LDPSHVDTEVECQRDRNQDCSGLLGNLLRCPNLRSQASSFT